MIGIFQLVRKEDGKRSEILHCSDEQLVEVLRGIGLEGSAVNDSYVLLLMVKLDGEEDYNYSNAPLITVGDFLDIHGASYGE